VLYIGRATSLYTRLLTHHRIIDVLVMDENAGRNEMDPPPVRTGFNESE
jgi:hypothetical protein